ncbi:hypothetical protein GQX73_g4612 [Xylaria multiplex]|uniref:Protein kinase domain-containing protein n=1 Tax=Xylaria multiplex TaxID=323545 RepID=A0A7C8MVD1_9PEZI|nr:hypothetical protein GQX73_g4612 [Xylaria multiplex]
MDGPVDIKPDNKPDNDSPPIDENLLDGPPPATWKDFKHAKLRQFPGHEKPIKWLKYLGHGAQGIVFKVSIGNGEPVALKIFWRSLRPSPLQVGEGKFRNIEWPFEDESRTVALIEKIKWAMSTNSDITIRKCPQTHRHALRNLYAFSDEGRAKPSERQEFINPPPFPPLPTCYGWMRIQRDEIPHVSPGAWNDTDNVDWRWAIVYEFIPGATQDLTIGQLHLDFFYAVGFSLEPFKPDNWHGGRLVDCNDICSVFTRGWRAARWGQFDAKQWFRTLDFVRYPIIERRIVRRHNKPNGGIS